MVVTSQGDIMRSHAEMNGRYSVPGHCCQEHATPESPEEYGKHVFEESFNIYIYNIYYIYTHICVCIHTHT